MKEVDRWQKLCIVGRNLELGGKITHEGEEYVMSENGNIMQVVWDNGRGVELPLSHVWKLVESLSFEDLFIMSSEVVLKNINKRL